MKFSSFSASPYFRKSPFYLYFLTCRQLKFANLHLTSCFYSHILWDTSDIIYYLGRKKFLCLVLRKNQDIFMREQSKNRLFQHERVRLPELLGRKFNDPQSRCTKFNSKPFHLGTSRYRYTKRSNAISQKFGASRPNHRL